MGSVGMFRRGGRGGLRWSERCKACTKMCSMFWTEKGTQQQQLRRIVTSRHSLFSPNHRRRPKQAAEELRFSNFEVTVILNTFLTVDFQIDSLDLVLHQSYKQCFRMNSTFTTVPRCLTLSSEDLDPAAEVSV
jgi:hypothetical protein